MSVSGENVSSDRLRRGGVAALIVVCVCILVGAFGLASSSSQEPSPSPEKSAVIAVTALPPLAVAGEPFPVAVSIGGIDSQAEAIDQMEVAFRLGPRVTSRSAFERATDGNASSSTLQLFTAPLEQGPNNTLTAKIGPEVAVSGRAGSSRLVLRSPGVYPLTISVRDADSGDDDAELTTFVIRANGGDDEPLRFAWIFPVYSAPPNEPGGDDSALRTSAATGAIHAIADVLTNTRAGVNLLADPGTAVRLASIAAERPENTEASTTFKKLVALAGRIPLVAGPYANVLTDAWQDVGGEVDPQFQTAASATSAIFGVTPDPSIQVAAGSAVPVNGLQTLQSQKAAAVVLAEDAVEDPGLKLTLTNTFGIDGIDDLRGAIADIELSGALTASGGPLAQAQQLLADLTVLQRDAPAQTRGAILLPAVDWQPSAALLNEAFSRIAAATYIKQVDLATFFAEVDDFATSKTKTLSLELANADAVPDASASAQYAAVNAARASANSFDAIVVGNTSMGTVDSLLLQSIDSSLVTDGATAAYAGAAQSDINKKLNSVDLPSEQNITITSRSATLPISIRNDSGLTLKLRLRLESRALRFPEGNTQDLVVPPRNFTTEVPVEAPSNGTFNVRLFLTSPDGSLSLAASTLEVRSTAVSTVAIALSVGSLAFLGFWWIFHARRRRGRRGGKHARTPGRAREPLPSEADLPDVSGSEPAGEAAGEAAGEPAGKSPGEPAGAPAGAPAGEASGSGTTTTDGDGTVPDTGHDAPEKTPVS